MGWTRRRYDEGDHQQVWSELLNGGAEERDDDETRAIVAETMRRGRHNVEVLVGAHPDWEQPAPDPLELALDPDYVRDFRDGRRVPLPDELRALAGELIAL